MNNNSNYISIKDIVLDKLISGDAYLFNHYSHQIEVSLAANPLIDETSKKPITIRSTVRWDFGDGFVTEGVTAVHSYTKPGKYEIKCTLYDLKGSNYDKEAGSRTVYVKEIVPTEISFINPENWKNKKSFICKNNKLGSLGISLSYDILSSPKITPIRSWDNGKDEVHYKDCKKNRNYHLSKYYTFLEEDESYSIDREVSTTILRPTESYTPHYFNIYGKVIKKEENGTVCVDAYISNEALVYNDFKWFKPYSFSDTLIKNDDFEIKVISDLATLPAGYDIIGQLGIVNIWYRNDYYKENATNRLLFEIDKSTIETLSSQDFLTESSNIPPLGISTILHKPDLSDANIRRGLTSTGLWRSNNMKHHNNKNINFSIEEYVYNNFYKDYTISAYYSYFIKNDKINIDDEPTYNILKSLNAEEFNSLTLYSSNVYNKCIIEEKTKGESYKIYDITPLADNFELIAGNKDVLYKHFELIDMSSLILPQEKFKDINVGELIDTYTPHTLFDEATNLKIMLKSILENKNILSRIVTKGDSLLDDNVNFKTCYVDKLISFLKMINEQIDKFNIDSFTKINEIRDLMRIFSMNYSHLFGNIFKIADDIKIKNGFAGKNVGDVLNHDDIIYCDKNYNLIAIKQNGKISKIIESARTPYIIVLDNFSNETTLHSFHGISSYEYCDFSEETEEWAKNNQDIIKEAAYCYTIDAYEPSWGWSLNLPEDVNAMTEKSKVINNFYSFYLYNPSNEYERKYNFVDEKTIPMSKNDDTQISKEEWEEDYGFMHHCLMKVLTDKLLIK